MTAMQEQPDASLARDQLLQQKPLPRAPGAAQSQPSHPTFALTPAWLRSNSNLTVFPQSHQAWALGWTEAKSQHSPRVSLQLESTQVSGALSSLACWVFKCCNSFHSGLPRTSSVIPHHALSCSLFLTFLLAMSMTAQKQQLIVKNFFLKPNINPPSSSLKPLPC